MAWLFNAGGNDGYNDTRNLLKVDTNRHGIILLPIKALAVAAGWTVKGSGRPGAFEFQGSTGGAGTGSGGAYDVWDSVANVSGVNSWCVLRSPAGDELLLVGTSSSSSGNDAYASLCYLPGGGYLAAGVAAGTPPATVAGELQFRSGRPFPSTGTQITPFNSGNCRFHIMFDDEEDQGVYRFLVAVTDVDSATPHDTWGVMTFEDPPAWETQAWCLVGAANVSGGGASSSSMMNALWERQSWGLASQRTFTSATALGTNHLCVNMAPTATNDDPSTGVDNMWSIPYIRQFGVANEEYLVGTVRDLHARGHTGLDYPNFYDVLLDDGVTEMRYIHWGTAGIPWGLVADNPPAPIRGAATTGVDSGAEFFNIRRHIPEAPPEPPDAEPPTLSNVSPAEGTTLTRFQEITFDVEDNESLRDVIIMVEFPETGLYEVIHDGARFARNYLEGSTREAIAGGWSYALNRSGGWPSRPTFRIQAIDMAGNEVAA